MKDIVKIFITTYYDFSKQIDSEETIGNIGYGIVINTNGKRVKEIAGGFSHTSNVRIELRAFIEALQQVVSPSDITVYLQMGYILDVINKGWIRRWVIGGFNRTTRHSDLWTKLYKIIFKNVHKFTFVHSKNCKDDPDFQLAEQLAKTMSGKENLEIDIEKKNPPAIRKNVRIKIN